MDKGFKKKIIVIWICIGLFILGTIGCMIFQEPLLYIVRKAYLPTYSNPELTRMYYPSGDMKIAIPFYMITCLISEIIYAAAITNVCAHEEKWTDWSTAKKLLIGRIVIIVVESVGCYVYMFSLAFIFGTFFHPMMDVVASIVTMPTWTIIAIMFLVLIIQIMIRSKIHSNKMNARV